MGDRNNSKNKKMKFLWRIFCKRRAMGPKTRKFRLTKIAKFCERLFFSADLQNFGEFWLNSVSVSKSILRHRNDSRLPKHDWEVRTVASLLSKIGKEELASAVVRWVPSSSSSSCAMIAGAADLEELYRTC